MRRSRSWEVLLLSAAPELHAAHMNSLRCRGATVHVAGRPAQASKMLRRAPSLVLVDLVYGPGLNPELVRMLNRARGRLTR